MRKTVPFPALRIATLALALICSGAVVAADNDTMTTPTGDCILRAKSQYESDDRACFRYPAFTDLFAMCRNMAIVEWGRATAACQGAAVSTTPIPGAGGKLARKSVLGNRLHG
jgi:hypothetical protein